MLLPDKVSQLVADSNVVNAWVHGPSTGVGSEVLTDGGLVRTPAKLIADTESELLGGTLFRNAMGQPTGAGLVGNLPSGTISATTVQTAINELDTEKASLVGLAAPTGAFLVGYLPAGTDAVATTVQDELRTGFVSSLQFMSDAQKADVLSRTKLLDVTAPLQAAYTYAQSIKKSLHIVAGAYKHSGITKSSSFDHVSIVGGGADCTEFDYSSFGSVSAITISGGSGSVTLSRIVGIQFNGAANGIGITLVGQGGVRLTDCRFGQNARGIVLHNQNSGEFSEFNVAENCEFTSACATALEYRVTAGNQSFHGSGLQNCLVNAKSSTDPVILVGNGCFVYNAPLSATVFPSPTGASIIYNKNVSGSLNNNWNGHINLEPSNSAAVSIAVNDSGARTFFSGGVTSVNNNWSLNDCILVDSLTIRTDGSVNYTPKPYTFTKTDCVNGSVVDLKIIDTYSGYDSGLMLNITLAGNNYRYTHVCAMSLDNGVGGGNQIAQLAMLQQFNSAGWGSSTFSIDGSNQLVITNAAGGFSVTAIVAVSPIGA
jgi:hypothetical protein